MQLEHSTASQILALLKRRPRGMTISDIARQGNLHRTTVATQLEIMHMAGQVELRTIGSAKVYSCAQRVPLSAFLCFTRNLILVLDANLRIVQANDQFLKLAKSTKTDLIGKTIEDVTLPVISIPEARAVIESLEKEQIITDIRYEHGGTESFYQMEVIPTTFEDGEKGATIVLEDITERKRYVRNMEFLAKTAMELVDMPPEQDIFVYITEKIAELVPNPRIFVAAYDEVKGEFAVQAAQDKGFRDGLARLLGREPVGITFPIKKVLSHPQGGNPLALLTRGIQEYVLDQEPGLGKLSLYGDIFFRQIPEEVCEEMRSTWNLGKINITFLVWEDRLFGSVKIFLSPGEELEDKQAIESFLRQASIALARRQTEERLGRSETRFREVLNHSPVAAAIIDTDGRYTFVNQRFTDLFGYTLADIPTGREWFAHAFLDPAARKEAITAWKTGLEPAGSGQVRPRTYTVHCKSGERKTILFRPVTLTGGNQYITYEETHEPLE
jgi:PAS domain S-box-containing protein